MKRAIVSVILAGICLLVSPAGAGEQKPDSTSTKALAAAELPQSVFVIPATSKEGRNPFFPQSKPKPELLQKKNGPVEVDVSGIFLNGITSPPRRTAMINGRTFEPGEDGEIKLSSGAKVMIKCAEIKDDAAIIVVNGQRRELKLRLGI